jgi:hypothetical protein
VPGSLWNQRNSTVRLESTDGNAFFALAPGLMKSAIKRGARDVLPFHGMGIALALANQYRWPSFEDSIDSGGP